jgi:hypothetical protein
MTKKTKFAVYNTFESFGSDERATFDSEEDAEKCAWEMAESVAKCWWKKDGDDAIIPPSRESTGRSNEIKFYNDLADDAGAKKPEDIPGREFHPYDEGEPGRLPWDELVKRIREAAIQVNLLDPDEDASLMESNQNTPTAVERLKKIRDAEWGRMTIDQQLAENEKQVRKDQDQSWSAEEKLRDHLKRNLDKYPEVEAKYDWEDGYITLELDELLELPGLLDKYFEFLSEIQESDAQAELDAREDEEPEQGHLDRVKKWAQERADRQKDILFGGGGREEDIIRGLRQKAGELRVVLGSYRSIHDLEAFLLNNDPESDATIPQLARMAKDKGWA